MNAMCKVFTREVFTRSSVTRPIVAAVLLLATGFGVQAAPRVYTLPDETAELAPGPHLDVVQGNCGACHSAEYIAMQPPGPNPRGFWSAEVTKMKKVYGAPLDDADVPAIVDYLVQTYGK